LALDTTYLILLSVICLLVSLFYLNTEQEPKYFYFIFPYVRLNEILVITTQFSILHFCMYYLPFVVYLPDLHVNHLYNIINTTLYIYICACITSLLWYLQYYQHIRYLHLYMHYLPFVVSTILSTLHYISTYVHALSPFCRIYNIINTLDIYICTRITSLLSYLQYYENIIYLHMYMHYLHFVVSTILSTH
jgi:hypothetical protein